ncbi:Vacuolar protein sorting-associated protein 70 [Thecaphora frezii]
MAPIPYHYSVLDANEKAHPLSAHLADAPLVQHAAKSHRDLEDGGSDHDANAAFFASAARSSRRHCSITLAFLATFAALYMLLFGATPPTLGLDKMLRDARAQLFGAHKACPHAAAVRGYADALDNLIPLAPAASAVASHHHGGSRLEGKLRQLEESFLGLPTAEGARDALKRYTEQVHIAGQQADYDSAVRLLEEWACLVGVDLPKNRSEVVFDAGSTESRQHVYGQGHHSGRRAWIDTYSVWLNYPINSSLTLTKPSSDGEPAPEPYFTAALKEDVLDEDPASAKGVATFHGYSASGAASGQIVYAGLGRKEDFEGLAKRGIDVKGKVVLVTYGGVFRGLKVRAAQEAGAVAVLIYTDPIEDGEITIANGYEAYPDGPARHPSAVQRGSVQGLSFYPGDPATPEKPSYRNATRLDPDTADSLPKIPSLPISYQDARPLLESLRGKGFLAKEINDRFPGALPGIEYWTGPSDDVAHVENFVDLKVRDIWNTYVVIPGLVDDEHVVLGNHRDAWTFGAADPSSGTAAFHETIKGLGQLLERGWKPLRTIWLASWDAEEYGLVGSTEFGEDYTDWIRDNVVIYHNVDVAVSGSQLGARASPSLAGHISKAAAAVADPTKPDGSNFTLDASGLLGSGSDFTVFLQHIGVASTDLGFSGHKDDPIYMYHSNYDSFYWMDKFGDPGFKRHEAAAKVVGVSTIRTAGSLFLPINVMAYSLQLEKQVEAIEELVNKSELKAGSVRLQGVKRAVHKVQKAARFVDKQRAKLEAALEKLLDEQESEHRRSHDHDHHHDHHHHHGRRHRHELKKVLSGVRRLNQKVRKFEQGFIDSQGLVGRSWYKHLGVAPGRWLGYGATALPGLTESITLDGGEGAQHEADRLEKHLGRIADALYQ